jgi:5'-nucleotidase
MIDAAGVRVGIVGAVTASTPRSSLAANVVGLDFVPPARAIAEEAQTLRRQGAQVVVAIVHEGGACTRFDEPERLDSCDTGSAVFAIARELPRGSVDVIVAGHTHQAVAQQVAGIPIIQSYANGRAFGRVDVTVDRATGAIATTHIQPPRDLCSGAGRENCRPGRYERRPVRMDSAIAKLNAPAFDAARTKSQERLAVEVLRPMPHNRGKETALGNLLVDLMRTARPSADVTLLNGGSMRAGLPAGPLTFGRLYETFPFDNMLAYANITASELARLLARSFQRSGSLVALSGLRVNVRCAGSGVTATLFRSSGKPVRDSEVLALLTNDFLATGGDGFFANAKLSFEMGEPLRDTLVESLRKRGGTLDPDDANLYDPNHPRIDLGGSSVPLRCPP